MHRFQANRVKIMDAGCGEGAIDESEKEIVLVAVDASQKMKNYALDWALANVVIHPGDRIVFLAVLPVSSSATDAVWKNWGFPTLGGECTSISMEDRNKEELKEVRSKCALSIDKLREIHDSKTVHVTIEIVQFARKGAVCAEAKRVKATWVVLDRNIKNEAKICLQEPYSNIVVVHRNNPKILRLNLKRRGLPVEEDSIDSSVLLDGLSLSVISKGFDQLYWENESSGSEANSPDPAPKFTSSLKQIRALPALRSSSNLRSPSEESFQRPQLLYDLLLRKETNDFSKDSLQSRPVERVSSVRQQIHLTKQFPSRPPPLCSICQHKTPVFGKPPKRFSFAELQLATGGFSEANFLAEGGYGAVYRGKLPDGQPVAVKQHKLASTQGDKEFCSEVEVLSCAQQRNLVMLIGYCAEENRRLLVYEFVCNGSLDSHLYGKRSKTTTLEWPSRQKIAFGAARALRYLHEECRVGCIVHRDMRPNNILLTHDFEPMVGDFGLARWQHDGNRGVETRVIGAFGYLAPEYTQTGQVTEKADVYSFGIVLLELVTGRKAVDMSRSRGEMCLSEWARPFLQQQKYERLIDRRLKNSKFCVDEVENMLRAAELCIHPNPSTRPRMSQILRLLEGDSGPDAICRSGCNSKDSPSSILSPGSPFHDNSSSASSSSSLRYARSRSGSSSPLSGVFRKCKRRDKTRY